MFSSKLLGQYQTENLSTHFNLVTYSAMLSVVFGDGDKRMQLSLWIFKAWGEFYKVRILLKGWGMSGMILLKEMAASGGPSYALSSHLS